MTMLCLLVAGLGAPGTSPIHVEVIKDFATFTHDGHPDNRIGYRFHEHTPLTYGTVPVEPEQSKESIQIAADAMRAREGLATYTRPIDEENWIPQTWTFYLAPAEDGIDILLVVDTEDRGLPEFYAVQQCFRLSGATNAEWRHQYALTPAFSEFDRWAAATDGSKPSLTWVVRNGTLAQLPGSDDTVGCRTPYGVAFDTKRTDGHVETLTHVGPYDARMLDPSDNGLILRMSADRQWSTGIYWERTTHLTDHHPADCLHTIVNIGGIPPHAQRAVRGKIYWLHGPAEDLVSHWRQDFPATADG